jgi:hypothetical protein
LQCLVATNCKLFFHSNGNGTGTPLTLHLEEAMDVDADEIRNPAPITHAEPIYRILSLGERACRARRKVIRAREERRDAALRVATALEYIAVRLGAIAESVARKDARLERREPSQAGQNLGPQGVRLDLFSHHSDQARAMAECG